MVRKNPTKSFGTYRDSRDQYQLVTRLSHKPTEEDIKSIDAAIKVALEKRTQE